jgi:hypothetical protein
MTASKFARRIVSLAKVSCATTAILSFSFYRQNNEQFFDNFLMPASRLLFPSQTIRNLGLFLCKWDLLPNNDYRDPFALVRLVK